MFADCPLTVVVESWRIPDRFALGQRAEASVEVIILRVNELDGYHAHAEHATDFLVSRRVAAHAIAGVQCIAAEECVARAFKAEVLRHVNYIKTVLGKPAAIVRLFALALSVAEARH